MNIVYLVGKRPDHTRHIRPAFARPGDSAYSAIVYECEFIKETPKGWKLRVIGSNRNDPSFWSAADYHCFGTKEAAAEHVRGALEKARDVLQARINHINNEIAVCTAIEVEAE